MLFLFAAAKCGNLDSPRNGRVFLTGNAVGSTATYRCNDGFVLTNGDRIRECGANGRWSGTAPSCVRKWLTIKTLSLSNEWFLEIYWSF